MTVILLEGVSCSGKSTIGKELSRRTGIPYIQGPRSFEAGWKLDDPQINYTAKKLSEFAVSFAKDIDYILDRCWISNIVYSRVYNRTPITPFFEQLAELSKSSNLIVIYVTANNESLALRIQEKAVDDSVYKSMLKTLQTTTKEFENFFAKDIADKEYFENSNNVRFPVITVDNSNGVSVHDNVNSIILKLEEVWKD
jgi:thymidylate kinase